MKYDVCLEMIFTDLPYEERIKKMAIEGCSACEFWFHDATFMDTGCLADKPKDAKAIKQACDEVKATVNNIVVNAPDGSFGGSPVSADDLNKYLERVEATIEFAKQIDCSMAITCSGNEQSGSTRKQMHDNLVKAYGKAAEIAEKHNFTLVVEPLNTYVDHEGYYLSSSKEAADIIRSIKSSNLKLLYDIYHMQIMEGNVIATIEKNMDIIGHFHSAGVPGRNEHFNGELDYPNIISRIEKCGYTGSFGLEYAPAMSDHGDSLRKVLDYLRGR